MSKIEFLKEKVVCLYGPSRHKSSVMPFKTKMVDEVTVRKVYSSLFWFLENHTKNKLMHEAKEQP